MVGATTWAASAELARRAERPRASPACCSPRPARRRGCRSPPPPPPRPTLEFTTGIAVAFPRSPMVSAALAWELAENTGGRYRLGLGSQVRAHVERRYGSDFDPPGPRMKDYVQAVQACLPGVPGRGAPRPRRAVLQAEPAAGAVGAPPPRPRRHQGRHLGGRPLDVPHGRRGGRRHPRAPLPLADYLQNRLLPGGGRGRGPGRPRPGRRSQLIVPVFAVPGDTPEEQAPLLERARSRSPSTAPPGTTPSSSTTSASRARRQPAERPAQGGRPGGDGRDHHRRDGRPLRRRGAVGTTWPTS